MSNLQKKPGLENNVFVIARRFEEFAFIKRTNSPVKIRKVSTMAKQGGSYHG